MALVPERAYWSDSLFGTMAEESSPKPFVQRRQWNPEPAVEGSALPGLLSYVEKHKDEAGEGRRSIP